MDTTTPPVKLQKRSPTRLQELPMDYARNPGLKTEDAVNHRHRLRNRPGCRSCRWTTPGTPA